MAIVSSTNQTYSGGTTAADWVWSLINLLINSAGWTKVRDSDGTTYSSSGAQVTGGGTGARGLRNASAWVELRAPGGAINLTIQHTTAAANLNWRVKVSLNAFSGGSPGATQTGSAVNEAIVLGGGTDAAPTFTQLVGQTDGGGYHGQFVAETVAPYRFMAVGYQDLGTNIHSKFILDSLQSWSIETGDTFAYVLHCAGGSAGADMMNATVLSDPATSQGAPWTWIGQPGTGTFLRVPVLQELSDNSGQTVAPDGGNVNPISGAYDLHPFTYERRSGATAPRGWKGRSTMLFWRPVLTHQTTDQYDIASAGAKDSIVLNQAVCSLWPAGVVPTGATAASTDRGSARLLVPTTVTPGTPAVTLVSPAPGAIAATTAVVVDATSAGASLARVVAKVRWSNYQLWETAYDSLDGFAPAWSGNSTVSGITNGIELSLKRDHGWVDNFIVEVMLVDNTGQEAHGSFTYTVAGAPAGPVNPIPPTQGNPVVTVVSPTPGTVIQPTDAIVVTATDVISAGVFRRIVLLIREPGLRIWEVVYTSDDGFAPAYKLFSTSVAIANGFQFSLRRDSGWPDSPQFKAYAIDASGQEAS